MNQGAPPYIYPTQILCLVAHEPKHCSNLQGIDLTASFIEQPKGFVDSREILADETLKVLWCLGYVYKNHASFAIFMEPSSNETLMYLDIDVTWSMFST